MQHGSRRWLIFAAAFAVLAADRVSKHVAMERLSAAGPLEVIPNVFHLTLVLNRGAAFGILQGGTVLFIVLTLLAAALIIVHTFRSSAISLPVASSLGLILGGAAGNLVDRVRFGYVIDFLDFRVWPVFNIADSAITLGAGILILNLLFSVRSQRTSGV